MDVAELRPLMVVQLSALLQLGVLGVGRPRCEGFLDAAAFLVFPEVVEVAR